MRRTVVEREKLVGRLVGSSSGAFAPIAKRGGSPCDMLRVARTARKRAEPLQVEHGGARAVACLTIRRWDRGHAPHGPRRFAALATDRSDEVGVRCCGRQADHLTRVVENSCGFYFIVFVVVAQQAELRGESLGVRRTFLHSRASIPRWHPADSHCRPKTHGARRQCSSQQGTAPGT